MTTKLLPIGIQDFTQLRESNCIYVDKTPTLFPFLSTPFGMFFLSRPRRFGKSLLLSMIEAIFRGKKSLFDGLWLADQDYPWPIHPVIRLDMSLLVTREENKLAASLTRQLQQIAAQYDISLPDGDSQDLLSILITTLEAKEGKVVVLVDEYDKPILDNITAPDRCDAIRTLLQGFYGILKGQGASLRLLLLTGVTRFAKVSVFSGLNNLRDLSFSSEAALLLGYTQAELEHYFASHIVQIADKYHCSREECLHKIRQWYNGYCFSRTTSNKVYNPFSTLLLFQEQEFADHWYQTATPSFLISLIRQKQLSLAQKESYIVSPHIFGKYDIHNPSAISLLLETGYLTIADYDEKADLLTLDYPNREVKQSFFDHLLLHYSHLQEDRSDLPLRRLEESLQRQDLPRFFSAP